MSHLISRFLIGVALVAGTLVGGCGPAPLPPTIASPVTSRQEILERMEVVRKNTQMPANAKATALRGYQDQLDALDKSAPAKSAP